MPVYQRYYGMIEKGHGNTQIIHLIMVESYFVIELGCTMDYWVDKIGLAAFYDHLININFVPDQK